MKISQLFFVLLFASTIAYAEEQVLKYDLSGSSNWIPYYSDDKANPGILGELIPLILSQANIKGKQITLPPTRTNLALSKGFLDFDLISPSWLKEDEKSEEFIFSAPIIEVKEHIVYLADMFLEPPEISIIKSKEVGTVRGYYYHDDDYFVRKDFGSEKELLIALKAKRVKYAIIGDLPALYWSRKLNIPIQLGPIHSSGRLSIRIRTSLSHLLPAINQSINLLNENGTIKETSDRYQLDVMIRTKE